MKDHYSFLAPFYNRLSKLVFGEQLALAKTCFLEKSTQKKTLIIGGGDGLDYGLFQNQLSGEYWEISKAMLDLAKVNLSESKLKFHLAHFRTTEGVLFDEVWLHFVLDTMGDEEIVELLKEIRKSMKSEGGIYLVDFFSPRKVYQRTLNWSMIFTFRVFARHKRKNLPDYEAILQSQNWRKNDEKDFLNGWVKAQIWSPS